MCYSNLKFQCYIIILIILKTFHKKKNRLDDNTLALRNIDSLNRFTWKYYFELLFDYKVTAVIKANVIFASISHEHISLRACESIANT